MCSCVVRALPQWDKLLRTNDVLCCCYWWKINPLEYRPAIDFLCATRLWSLACARIWNMTRGRSSVMCRMRRSSVEARFLNYSVFVAYLLSSILQRSLVGTCRHYSASVIVVTQLIPVLMEWAICLYQIILSQQGFPTYNLRIFTALKLLIMGSWIVIAFSHRRFR
jgi:hypothetical protein